MVELGRMLRIDARRTAVFISIPVLVLVGIAAAWPTLLPGVAYWDNAVAALGASVRLLGPAAAALGAWVAVREHRLDYLRELTTRSPAVGPLLDLLLLTAVTLLAYGIVGTIVLVQTALGEDAGRLHPLGLLAGAAALTLHVVIGFLLGRLVEGGPPAGAGGWRGPLPVALAALLAGGGTWLWAALRSGDAWWSLLPPAAIDRVGLYAGVRPGLFADQMLWSLGLATAMVVSYAWSLDRRAALAVPILAGIAVTMVATARIHSYGGAAAEPAPTGSVCRHWPLKVCVHPALRAALPDLEAALTPLAARLNGTPAAFTRVEQRPADQPAGVRHGVAGIHLPDLSPGYQVRAVRELRATLTGAASCAAPHHARGAAYTALVNAWLLDEDPPYIHDATAARRFARWSEGARHLWLRQHYAHYRACLLGPSDFAWQARPPL
ncbi:MAG TPA: hypothetical protein VFU43_19015 [Streptosporangiaceae bacterium]|nr:hypothetical protein [Streptosporangiaceae bacterium]